MENFKISNPLEEDIKLIFKGNTYRIQAGKAEEFAKEVADKWIEIYGFLTAEVVKVADKVTKKSTAKTTEEADTTSEVTAE
jgi:hypothetical protein